MGNLTACPCKGESCELAADEVEFNSTPRSNPFYLLNRIQVESVVETKEEEEKS